MKEKSEQVLTRKMRRILLITLIFTGGCSVSSLVEIVQDTLQGVWSYIGWAQYLYTMVFCSVIILFFFTILLLYWTHRSFADIFSKGILLIGAILTTAAFVIPRIPDYQPVHECIPYYCHHSIIEVFPLGRHLLIIHFAG